MIKPCRKCGDVPVIIDINRYMWDELQDKAVRILKYELSCLNPKCDNKEFYSNTDKNETIRLWNRTDEEKTFEAKYGYNPYKAEK